VIVVNGGGGISHSVAGFSIDEDISEVGATYYHQMTIGGSSNTLFYHYKISSHGRSWSQLDPGQSYSSPNWGGNTTIKYNTMGGKSIVLKYFRYILPSGPNEGILSYIWKYDPGEVSTTMILISREVSLGADALAINPNASPSIVYSYSGTLECLSFNPELSVWMSSTIETTSESISAASIFINTAGDKFVAYIKGTYKVFLATNNGEGWSSELIHEGGASDVPSFPMLRGDSDGRLHLIFKSNDVDSNISRLYYYNNSSGSWSSTYTEFSGQFGGTPAIALNTEGRPRFAFSRWVGAGKGTYYASCEAANWMITTVEAEGLGYYGDLSMVFDVNNKAHIIYGKDLGSGTAEVKHAYQP
jgi:hypothetical protein